MHLIKKDASPAFLSHLRVPGQLLHIVGVFSRLSVSENYKLARMQPRIQRQTEGFKNTETLK